MDERINPNDLKKAKAKAEKKKNHEDTKEEKNKLLL